VVVRKPEDAAAVGCDLDRHAFAHAAETVEHVMADELEIPGDRFAVAAWTFRGGAPRHGFLRGGFFRRRFLRPLLALCSLRDLLACDFHSTLPALTSRGAFTRLPAAGGVAPRSPAVRPAETGGHPGRAACGPLATGTIGVSLRSPVRAEVNSRHCCGSSSSECAVARQLAYAAASNRHDPTTEQCKRDYERCDKQYIKQHSEVP